MAASSEQELAAVAEAARPPINRQLKMTYYMRARGRRVI